MSESLQALAARLVANDATALSELGETLLPFVNAAVLARATEPPAPRAVLGLFVEVARLAAAGPSGSLVASVIALARQRADGLPGAASDARRDAAFAALRRLAPLRDTERELVLARFVERLSADAIETVTGVALRDVQACLARGAQLLMAGGGTDWARDAYLQSLEGSATRELAQLENQLTVLAADLSELEASPAASPAAGRGDRTFITPSPEAEPPRPQYPSQVATFAASDLPAALAAKAQMVGDDSTESMGRALPRPPTQVHTMVPVNVVTPVQPLPAGPAAGPLADTHLRPSNSVPMAPTFARPSPSAPPRPLEVTPPMPPGENWPSRPGQPQQTETTPRVGASDPEVTPVKPPQKFQVPLPLALRELQNQQTEHRLPPATAAQTQLKLPSVEVDQTLPSGQPVAAAAPPSRGWIPFLVAGLFGTAAFCAAALVLHVEARDHRQQWPLMPVLVANRDLAEGELVPLTALSTRMVPAMLVTTSIVSQDNLALAVDQRLHVPMQAGDPLLWTHFESAHSVERLSRAVERRMRAFAVPVGEVQNVGGWAAARERADFLLTVRSPKAGAPGEQERQAVTLLQDVYVLAVGKKSVISTTRVQKSHHDVSVLLLPEEAEMLSLASGTGDLTMTLRTDQDHEQLPREANTTIKTLLEGERVKFLQHKREATISRIRQTP